MWFHIQLVRIWAFHMLLALIYLSLFLIYGTSQVPNYNFFPVNLLFHNHPNMSQRLFDLPEHRVCSQHYLVSSLEILDSSDIQVASFVTVILLLSAVAPNCGRTAV
ncbi:hypothetical protein BJ878DRAFT_528746 [Calycina marina]|uniref:Uncharacterized protein n=1 Tax=Calycina marina TaxID=1763456 RepID=A0A9P8CAL2_9HELO|nr:hypothetical protein BJ878DRAFT_528746 [Calycina marina]